MRENLTYGSEGGEGLHPFPTPIGDDYCIAMSADQATAGRNATRLVPTTRVRMSERKYAKLRNQVLFFSARINSATRRPSVFLPLDKLDHDALRSAHESESQPGIAGERTDSDLGTFGAQFFHCRINIVDRQPDML